MQTIKYYKKIPQTIAKKVEHSKVPTVSGKHSGEDPKQNKLLSIVQCMD